MGKEGTLRPEHFSQQGNKGRKDGRILTEVNEANEGLSNARPNPGRKSLVHLLLFPRLK
jgi:hypothetical protein